MEQDEIVIYINGTTVIADPQVIYNPFPDPPKDEKKE